MFCEACLIDFVDSIGRMACPSCTKLLTFDNTANNDKGDSNSKHTLKGFSSSSILNKIQLNEFETSTKIEALVCYCILRYHHILRSLLFLYLHYVNSIAIVLRGSA